MDMMHRRQPLQGANSKSENKINHIIPNQTGSYLAVVQWGTEFYLKLSFDVWEACGNHDQITVYKVRLQKQAE